MAILLPWLHFAIGITNNLQITSWREWLVHGVDINPPDQALLGGVVSALPWNLKIFAAFLSDVVPICGKRRLPYLIMGFALQGAAWVSVGIVGDSISFPLLALQQFCTTMGQVLVGVMCDTLIVENVKYESGTQVGRLQTNCQLMFAAGGLLGTLLSGWLPQYAHFSYTLMFVITGASKLVLLLLVVFLHDPTWKREGTIGESASATWGGVWESMSLIRVLKPLIFIFAFAMMPNNSDAFNTYLIQDHPICAWNAAAGQCDSMVTDDSGTLQYQDHCRAFAEYTCDRQWGGLGFSDSMFSYIGLLGSVGSVLGNFIFKAWLINAGWHIMFASTVVIACAFSAGQLFLMIRNDAGQTLTEQWHLPNFAFALGDDVIMATAQQLLNMPILILMARLCPAGAEGTVYALVTSIQGVGGTVGGVFSKVATQSFDVTNVDFSRIWELTVLTSSAKMICLLLLPLVPRNITDNQDEHKSPWSGVTLCALFLGGLVYALYNIASSLISSTS
eukprot:CAMPEP_0204328978 /NCGR_PEP_ID=MMETSP0469-20131031/13811_1 /ASSEMBLY_ACC=CAM_ASM_000384 /TAXON_ID=2969 /ORGANISM="Oxyrrhis marina" /LENGTH=503 /DNA_ID=CAMNT_0051311497 /DNA_START=102 /DNA_END=1613 /DNA_ORIENTATION=-